MLRKSFQVARARPAPAVDRLILVSDHAEVLARSGQQLDQLLLRAVGVLELIDHQILESLAPCRPRVRMFAQQLHGPQQQIVEIHGRSLVQDFLIRAENLRHILAVAVVRPLRIGFHIIRRDAVIFRVADLAAHAARRIVFGSEAQLQNRALHCRVLVVVIVDSEVARQSEMPEFAPQQSRTERMKRRNPYARGVAAARAQKLRDALFHHARGFVRERDRKNRARRHAHFDQVRHAIGDHARLARACPRQHQHRAFRCQHGLALFLV